MIKRNYRTDEEWLALIQECRASGLTDKQWCEEHGICPSNFYYQIRKFRKLACEIPERQTKSSLAFQKQEVVQVTLEQPVQQEPQTYQTEWKSSEIAISVQVGGIQVGITNAASEEAVFNTISALRRLC